MAQQPTAQRLVVAIRWVVGLVVVAAAARCTIVGFNGGRMPIFGNHVRGSAAHGLLWLFIAGSFAFGIFEIVALLLDYTTRSRTPVARAKGAPTTES